MPWVKLDDQFADHPKLDAAGPLAGWLHVCALCYCARWLTDGRIPKGKVGRLADVEDPAALAARLVEVGLWEDHGDAYMIHDYHHWNPPAEEERERRAELSAKRSEAGRKGAEARWGSNGNSGKEMANAMASATELANGSDGNSDGNRHGKSMAPSPSPSPSPISPVEVIRSVTSTAYAELDDDDEIGRLLVDVAATVGLADFERAVADGVDVPTQPHRRAGYLRKCIRNRHENDPALAEHVRRTAGIGDAQAIARGFLSGPAATPPSRLTLLPPLTADPNCPYCEGDSMYRDDHGVEVACECRMRGAS